MRYRLNTGVVTKFKDFPKRFVNLTTALIIAATGMSGAAPLFFSSTANAAGTDTTYSYDFSGYTGGDSWTGHSDWSFSSGMGYYDDTSTSCKDNNCLKFQNDSPGDSATLNIPLTSGQQINKIAYWAKANPGSGSTDQGTFSIDQSTDGSSWTSVTAYDGSSIQTGGAISTIAGPSLSPSAKYLRFTWDKTSGNVALDDVNVTVNNPVNTAPVITSNGGGSTASVNVTEGTTAVTTVKATDSDNNAITYNLGGGADQGMFSINSSTGVLTFKTAQDFSNPSDADDDGNYEVIVQASDGNGGTDTQAITVTVTQSAQPVVNTRTHETFNTIQAAINDSDTHNGDTITVAAGSYSGNVTVSKSVTLEGTQAGQDARSRSSSESTITGSIKVTADNVTIDGFTLTNASPIKMDSGALNSGSSPTNNTGETIENNIINVNGGTGIDLNSNDTTIKQNVFNMTNGIAIVANNNPWHDITISDNTITGTSYIDMNFIGSKSYDATNAANAINTSIVVSGNTSTTHTGNFLMSTFIDGFTITNNTISNKTGSTIILGGNDKNVTITGNTVSTAGSAVNIYRYVDGGHPGWPAWPVNGKIIVNNNDFSGSATGVSVAQGSVDASNLPVDATNNWWGNPAGPTDTVSGDGSIPETNGTGTHGSKVVGAVKYGTWCTAVDCSTNNQSPPAAPTDLYFTGHGNNYQSGYVTNQSYSGGSMNLHWTPATSNSQIKKYRIERTYPSGHVSTYTILPGTSTPLYNFTKEGQGYYLYRVQVESKYGTNNWSPWSAQVKVGYDTSSPTAHFTQAPANNSFVNGNFHVAGTASDNVKLKGVFFDVRDPQDTTGNAYRAGCVGSSNLVYTNDNKDATLECDINTSGLLEGHQYIVRIHAGDFAGYGGGESRTFTVDRTNPVIEINNQTPQASYKAGNNDRIDVHVIEANLDYVDVDRTDTSAPNNNKHRVYHGNYFGLWWLNDGKYTLTAHDKAGNTNTVTFVTDKTKPHVDTNSTTATSPEYNPANFTIHAEDTAQAGNGFTSGLNKVTGNIYKFDSVQNKYVLVDGDSSTTQNPFTVDLGGLNDGKYYVRYNAADKVGNVSNTEQFYFVVDHTVPTMDLRYGENGAVIPSGSTINNTGKNIRIDKENTATIHVTKPDGSTWTGGKKDASYHGGKLSIDWLFTKDGTYTFYVEDEAGNISGNYTITIDTAAPAAPTITAPGARTWHKSSPITNSWTKVTEDVNGNNEHVDHYQVAYAYDDGHSFSGSTCSSATIGGVNVYCRDASGTSRNHQPGANEQGGVTIWVRAIDKAGNVGTWSKSVHYYYDHVAPATDINVTVSNGKLTVSGNASDNLALNRVYVQLVNREDGHRYGGTTINLIPDGKTAYWSKTYDMKALGYPDGHYAANVSVTDMAGNSFNPGWTANFTVDTTAPVVSIPSYGQTGNIFQPNVFVDGTNTPAAGDYIYSWVADSSNPGTANYNASAMNPQFTVTIYGTYKFYLTATDKAGNSSTPATMLAFIYANPNPNSNSRGGTNGNFTNATTQPAQSNGNDGFTPTGTPTPITNNGNGANAPQVLGVHTSKPNSKVMGDSTDLNTSPNQKNATDSGAFLGLGWWWLLVLAVILYLFWFILGRRSNSTNKSS